MENCCGVYFRLFIPYENNSSLCLWWVNETLLYSPILNEFISKTFEGYVPKTVILRQEIYIIDGYLKDAENDSAVSFVKYSAEKGKNLPVSIEWSSCVYGWVTGRQERTQLFYSAVRMSPSLGGTYMCSGPTVASRRSACEQILGAGGRKSASDRFKAECAFVSESKNWRSSCSSDFRLRTY